MIQFQSDVSCWESLVEQRVEKQIKSEVGADWRTWAKWHHWSLGATALLCLYSIFSKNELHCTFLLGTPDWVCVCLKGERDAEFEQNLTKKHKHTRMHEYQLFQVNELWNMQLLFPPSSLPFVVGKSWVQRKLGQEQAKSKRKKKKGEHFLRVRWEKKQAISLA